MASIPFIICLFAAAGFAQNTRSTAVAGSSPAGGSTVAPGSSVNFGSMASGSAVAAGSAANGVPRNGIHRFSSSRGLSEALLPLLQDTTADNDFPDPNSVMYKSMIIPGWGQIVNRQIWKVPIVYGLIGGLAGYSIFLHKRYHDYRAAYYNLNPETPDDMQFGPTPDYIPETTSLESIRSARNTYRNRRDMVYIGVVLAYGLNIVDAYVFAHMRTFDVSEDLSMRTRIQPSVLHETTPAISLSVDIISK